MDVGVIGVGSMGKNHARIYSELKSVNSLTVYDTNEKTANSVADAYGATAVQSVKSLLDRSDAVSICVPTKYHAEVVADTFAAGIHTLIEKPICSNSLLAKSLIYSIPPGLIVGVGHIERFNPVVSEIKKIMRKPLYIEMKRHNPASSRIAGTSVVDDLMIHDIDILLNVFNIAPVEMHSTGNDDVCSVMMNYDDVPVMLSASRRSSKKIRSIYIEEPDFTVEGDLMSQEILVYRKPGQYHIDAERYVQENIIEKVTVNKQEPLKQELNTFITCVKNNTEFPVTPQQATHNLEICEYIRNYLETGGC